MTDAEGRHLRPAARLHSAMARFDPCARAFQVGRTMIASAQASVVVLTPWDRLSPELAGVASADRCAGVARWSSYCVAPVGAATALTVIVLAAVCAGLLPRLVGPAHAYVSYSIAVGIGLPDGGEQVAQMVTILVGVMTLADGRLVAWRPARAQSAPGLTGSAYGAWWLLRIQVSGIYAHSGLAKLGVEDWANGTAMFYVVRDPSFGASGPVRTVMAAVTDQPLGTALLSWGTIGVEVVMAVLLLAGPSSRRRALAMACVLHVGILVVIGLWSFALIMIGAVILAAAPAGKARAAPESGREEYLRPISSGSTEIPIQSSFPR